MPTEETDDKFHRTRPCGEKAGFTAVKEREHGGIQPLVCAYIYFEHHSLNSKGKSCVDKSHSLILKEMLFPFALWKTWIPQTAQFNPFGREHSQHTAHCTKKGHHSETDSRHLRATGKTNQSTGEASFWKNTKAGIRPVLKKAGSDVSEDLCLASCERKAFGALMDGESKFKIMQARLRISISNL